MTEDMLILADFVLRVTHWSEGGTDRHEAVEALKRINAHIMAGALNVPVMVENDRRYRLLRQLNWHDHPICCVTEPRKSVVLGSDCPSLSRLDAILDDLIVTRCFK